MSGSHISFKSSTGEVTGVTAQGWWDGHVVQPFSDEQYVASDGIRSLRTGMLVGTLSPVIAPVAAGAYFSPLTPVTTGKAYLGYYPSSSAAPTTQEGFLGKQFNLHHVYWNSATDLSAITSTAAGHLAAGYLTVLDLDFCRAYGKVIPNADISTLWADMTSGLWNTDNLTGNGNKASSSYYGLDSVLTAVKNLQNTYGGTPGLIVTLFHEMDQQNESGGNGSAVLGGRTARCGTQAEFGACFRYIVGRARTNHSLGIAQTVGQVEWGFDPAYNPTPAGHNWGTALTDNGSDGYYPGHDVTDWVGGDPYNYAGITGHGTGWLDPASIFQPYIDWWNQGGAFKVGGAYNLAQATGGQGVYKPAGLWETGTMERFSSFTGYVSNTHDARDWMQRIMTWILSGQAKDIYKAVLWFGTDGSGAVPSGSSTTGSSHWWIVNTTAESGTGTLPAQRVLGLQDWGASGSVFDLTGVTFGRDLAGGKTATSSSLAGSVLATPTAAGALTNTTHAAGSAAASATAVGSLAAASSAVVTTATLTTTTTRKTGA